MEVINIVLAADRHPSAGHLIRLLVGIADQKTHNWLQLPVPMAADFVATCIRSGQAFQVFAYGEAGPLLAVGPDGNLTTAVGSSTKVSLADLPPLTPERPLASPVSPWGRRLH